MALIRIKHRIKNNYQQVIKFFCKICGIIFTGISVCSVFIPFSTLLEEYTFLIRIMMIIKFFLIILFISLITSVLFIWLLNKREIVAFNNNHIYVQYGDIFSEKLLSKEILHRITVIPVNRCFDTIVDDEIVAKKSLHGEAMKNLYSSCCNKYSTSELLNKEIQKNLELQEYVFEQITTDEKRKGNLKRYPVGAVAEINDNKDCKYWFLALSTFDKNLKAHTSDEDYILALMRLVEYASLNTNHYPIVLPLIGCGLSRTNKEDIDVLEYMIALFQMNKMILKSDIYIVIPKEKKAGMPISKLKRR